MFDAANQVVFRLDIEGFSYTLDVLEFHAKEALNRPYTVELKLVSEYARLDLESLLHRPAFLTFGPDETGIHGLIYRIAQGDSGNHLNHYQITLAPRLAYLAHRYN